ncbi:tripartite tricarboxylate transporter substrate binding protein [Paucibacter sp. PLA-PC-4]|uniref:Bug family tripartite tricarboxylate transporter substrate binding protein n=1 Tax=Paucibacter sp. PLA-PC-4 TaxID=2993655 RepID=UPI0022488244|nr:tripartite tricarboxylate transporter substrate binding protein [Paucibacter sp. PLA-PC-4]MCX2861158.1 tripartite tricarboxylate transporter substrate binding protein [Paucibacter sp. PLA-PC-4]
MSVVSRRSLLLSMAAAAATPAFSYPDKPVEWVVPYPAGGGADVVARSLAEAMGKTLGQTLIINNKPGAATNIGADYVAKSKADGQVLLTADTATLAANPWLYSKLPYKAEQDLAPVGLVARFPMLLVVNAAVPVKNYKEFLAWAKTQDGLNYATPGAGSPHHLATELLRDRTKLSLTHIPYRGAAPAVQDVIGGQVPFMFVDTAAGYPHILSGKLRALAVASPARIKTFAEVPTFAEQGLPGFEAYAWQGLVVPTGTPAPVIATLNKSLQDALASTAVKARFQTLGLEALGGTPEQMRAYWKQELAKWGQVIKAANIKLD